jgi:hypothetical protein
MDKANSLRGPLPPSSRSRSEGEGEKQTLSDTSAGYRDRPADDGKHGDAGAVQAENVPHSG